MKPKIVDWRITSKCNQNCLYCYAMDYSQQEIFSNEDKNDEKIIKKIVKIGCDSVCISGGEPLLYENGERAYRIIKALKEKGISNIFLSTNGTNFLTLEKKYNISRFLSKLSLPLDGYDEESSKHNGHASSFRYVKEILENLNNAFCCGDRIPKIKISTVVTKNNINDQEYWDRLSKFIAQYPIVRLWKIYDFVPENRGAQNREKLSYTLEEFENFKNRIISIRESLLNIPLELVQRKTRNQVYFIILPNGRVVIPQDKEDITEEVYIGNLLEDKLDVIISNWNDKINSEKCGIYSIGRKLLDKGVIREDNLSKCLLSKISGNMLYSMKSITTSTAYELNLIQEDVVSRFIQLKSGEESIIREVIPLINLPELGLQVYLISLTFNDNAGFTVGQIAENICNHKSVGWCAHYNVLNDNKVNNAKTNGKIFFRISIFAPGMPECIHFIEEIIDPIRIAFVSQFIDYVPEKYVAYARILNVQQTALDGYHIQYHMPQNNLSLSKREKEVLQAMSEFRCTNCLCFETLLEKLQSNFPREWKKKHSIKLLKNAMDLLRKNQIINTFQLVMNDKSYGYYTFLIIYDLHPIYGELEKDLKKDFKHFAESLSDVTHVNVLNAGDWDVDIEIKVKARGELSQTIATIDERFGNEIRNRLYLELVKEYKFTFLIPIVVDAINKAGGK